MVRLRYLFEQLMHVPYLRYLFVYLYAKLPQVFESMYVLL